MGRISSRRLCGHRKVQTDAIPTPPPRPYNLPALTTVAPPIPLARPAVPLNRFDKPVEPVPFFAQHPQFSIDHFSRYDSTGNLIKAVNSVHDVWGVNIPADGRLVAPVIEK